MVWKENSRTVYNDIAYVESDLIEAIEMLPGEEVSSGVCGVCHL